MKKIIENNKCLYFLKELLKYKKEIGILSISTIVSTVTVFLQPLLIKQITDIGILEKNMPQIVNGVAGLFVCVLVYLMIEVVQAKTFAEIHNSFASPQTWVLAMKNPRILRGLRRFYRNDQDH